MARPTCSRFTVFLAACIFNFIPYSNSNFKRFFRFRFRPTFSEIQTAPSYSLVTVTVFVTPFIGAVKWACNPQVDRDYIYIYEIQQPPAPANSKGDAALLGFESLEGQGEGIQATLTLARLTHHPARSP